LLLKAVLLELYLDVSLVRGYVPRPREPRFVELIKEISDDVASHIDGCKAPLGGAA
jgi:hypothetical protein